MFLQTPKNYNYMILEFKKFILSEMKFYLSLKNNKLINNLEKELNLPLLKYYNYIKSRQMDNDLIQYLCDLWLKIFRIKIVCEIDEFGNLKFIKYLIEG